MLIADYVNHSFYFEARTFLHGLLVVEDKLSMAHSLETRVPFLDNDLVDFAMQIPVNLKLKMQKIKRKQAAIAALTPFENEFKDIQKRLGIYSDLVIGKPLMSDLLINLASYLPPDVILTSITLNTDALEIIGITPSEIALQQLSPTWMRYSGPQILLVPRLSCVSALFGAFRKWVNAYTAV
jgi:hypothetical protein